MEKTVLMEEMTWREIQQALENGKNTAILVAASIEQHGPHLPTATDTIIGYALAEAVAKTMGNALVAPVIRPALSHHHMDFPGSITLHLKTFLNVLEEYCFSLRDQGFGHIVMFVSHGGNADAVKAFLPGIAKKLGRTLQLLYVYPLEKNIQSLQEFLSAKGISPAQAGVHAGFAETAVMLFLKPELVNMEKTCPGLTDEAFYMPENIGKSKMDSFIHGIKSQSEKGILGDPTGASADIGKEIFHRKVKDIVTEIENNLQK
ncbi:MAG: creatininase family protein [Deltaproteobacteria bacterium]|nr:creatininase family protein [Deltaproteobacteria bacterium]MBW1961575.1 creatininase family protein [Deltaproteobacteria bacterium]MBW2154057.1 creatininase family protein [Deltaproteobacteria bacterium]